MGMLEFLTNYMSAQDAQTKAREAYSDACKNLAAQEDVGKTLIADGKEYIFIDKSGAAISVYRENEHFIIEEVDIVIDPQGLAVLNTKAQQAPVPVPEPTPAPTPAANPSPAPDLAPVSLPPAVEAFVLKNI